MRFRVSPAPASSDWASNAPSGRPVLAFLQPRRRRICELPRILGPFGCTGDGSSSRPEFRILQRCRFHWSFESPRFFSSSCNASDVGLRLPLVLHLRLYRRWDLQVAPNLSSFGGADCPTFGFPLRSVLRYRRRSAFLVPLCRFPQIANLPAPAGGRPSFPGVAPSVFAIVESSGRPESSSLARRRANFKVALNLRSLGVAVGLIFESPRISFLQLCRLCILRLPRFRIYGWVDDESPACPRTLHPRLAPRMNLRVQRVRHSLPDSPCSLNLLSHSSPAS
jgi:hypothetical protein